MADFKFIEAEQLDTHLVRSGGLKLVHFGSSLVTSCNFMRRSLSIISPEFQNHLQMIEVELQLSQVEVVQRFQVRSLPTILIFDGVQVVERLERILLPAELRQFLQDTVSFHAVPEILPKPEEPGPPSQI
ncbi:MAG: thioredoxin family protein [Planctomycetota bacterium]